MGMAYTVLCKDGTKDEGNPSKAPCVNNGGIDLFGGLKTIDFGTVNQIHSPFGGKLPIVKPTTNEVKQQNLLAPREVKLTAEDKFYEILGIKKTDGSGWGLQSRPVGRLLVAVVLVGGYFAYKKFKK
jgi:hypothetical protein